MKNCIDCGKKISKSALHRCWKCFLKFNKGENHPCYVDGSSIKKICLDCGKVISKRKNAKRCVRCAAKERTKDLIRVIYYCKKCHKPISAKKVKLCLSCYKEQRKPLTPHCLECGKTLSKSSIYYSKSHKCGSCVQKGKKRTQESINKQKLKISGKNCYRWGKTATHSKYLKYNNLFFHSSWEVKFAQWCDKNKIKWFYEPKAFDLGNTTYTPDFYLSEFNIYIEVKGFWRDDALKKFEEFKQKYCGIKIRVLEREELKSEGIIK